MAVILEEMRDQHKAVLEAVGQLQDTVKTLATKDDLSEVKSDVKIIRAVLTDQSKEIKDLDMRVAAIEQAA